MLYLTVWLGCVGSTPDAPERGASDAEAWAFSDTGGSPAFDVEVASSDLQALVTAIHEVTPDPLLVSYAAARAHGDETCPPEETLQDGDVRRTWWYGTCGVPATQTRFNGVMTQLEWEAADPSAIDVVEIQAFLPPGFTWSGLAFDGRIDIYDSADTFDFSCSCAASVLEGVAADGSTARVTTARGPAAWTGADAAGTWLDQPGLLADVARGLVRDPSGATTAGVIASVSGPGERYRALSLNVVSQLPPGETSRCTSAQGQLFLRDSLTGQRRVLAVSWDGAAEGCTVCGDVDGDSLCVDLAPALGLEAGAE